MNNKKVLEVIESVKTQGDYFGKLNFYEINDLSRLGFKCLGKNFGKYLVTRE